MGPIWDQSWCGGGAGGGIAAEPAPQQWNEATTCQQVGSPVVGGDFTAALNAWPNTSTQVPPVCWRTGGTTAVEGSNDMWLCGTDPFNK